jgi:hypothetical protein
MMIENIHQHGGLDIYITSRKEILGRLRSFAETVFGPI